MIKDQESGYNQLVETTEDFKQFIQEHYQYLDEHWSDSMLEVAKKKPEPDDEMALRTAGKAVMAVANAERLTRIAPYLKYAGMSNKAVKAAMVKDAVHVVNMAKASGMLVQVSTKLWLYTECTIF